jgi:hydrophobic/amphiphilic exporter-1 (mainly G- bacteria), HAE1 family
MQPHGAPLVVATNDTRPRHLEIRERMKRHRIDRPLNGMSIADTAIKQPVLVLMLMLLLLVLGLIGYNAMPVNRLPDIDLGTVVVRVTYPGAGSETIAEQVTKPVEDALTTVSGVKTISSNSSANIAVITVEFNGGVNTEQALQDMREKVNGIRASLPAGIDEPVYERLDPSASPVLSLAVTSAGGQDGRTLRALLDNEIVPLIQRAPGVGSITLTGGQERQINVALNFQRLQALRILPSQVSAAIAGAATDLGLGTAQVAAQEYNLRAPSVFRQPQDIAQVGIAGTPYTVGDVATIIDGTDEVATYARFNGQDAITLDVRKQSGTNTVAVADAALREIEAAFAAYADLRYEVIINEADEVRENVNGAIEEIIFAVVFAVLVVMVFFSGLRTTLLTAALPALVLLVGLVVLPAFHIHIDHLGTIALAVALLMLIATFTARTTVVTVIGLPVIIIATFAGLSAFGLTINILSLLALSVSVGLVIDDAIVVRENIFRQLERGVEPLLAASRGTAQVATSVLAMTLTVIAVFVPAAFATGPVGILFQNFGITIGVAMLISIIEAFTLGPVSTATLMSTKQIHLKPHTPKVGEEHLPAEATEELGPLERAYERLLRWSLRRRFVMVGVAAAVVALSIVAASGLKFAFLPERELHQFALSIKLPPGTPLDATDQAARAIEAQLGADQAVRAVLTTVGGAGQLGTGGAEQARFTVLLHDDAASIATIERLRPQLADAPGLMFGIPTVQGAPTTEVAQRPLVLQLRSTGTLAELAPVADQVKQALVGVPGLADVDSSYTPGKPELQYRLRQAQANDYNLSNGTLATTMRALVDGDDAATYREGGDEYDIVVRLRPEDRTSVEGLQTLRLPMGNSLVPLRSIAAIEVADSPATIRRTARQTEIVIGGNNIGRNINDVLGDMQARLATLTLPPGVTATWGGQSEDQAEGFGSLLVALGLAVLLVYMILAAQFASFTQPLIIMLAMPLSFVGAFMALSLSGQQMDILAMIGLLMLMGLVVKNSILLIDFTNKLQDAKLPKDDALARAGAVRLRPILMTSGAIVLGATPAAIGLGEGAELRRALATVLIGGVLTSTLLTLLLVPVAASLLQSVLDRLDGWKARRAESAPQTASELVLHEVAAHEAQAASRLPAELQPRSNHRADVPLASAATRTPEPQND